MDDPLFGSAASSKAISQAKKKPVLGRLTNAEGGLVYDIIDLDFDTDIFELVDPHTKAPFLLYDARNILNTLGYKTKSD